MDFQFDSFDPPRELSRCLRSSFFAKGRIRYRTDKILPTGLIPALFNLGRPHRVGKSPDPDENAVFSHSWVDGFQSTPTYHTPTEGTHVLGLLFEPIGFHALFGADMVAYKDRTVDARELMPADFIATMESVLRDAESADTHQFIHDRLLAVEQADLPHWLWDFYASVVTEKGSVDIEKLYEMSGHSARHAIAVFKRAVGVSPKVLCRIHRLLALLEEIDPSDDVNWTELAHRFSFYDQAHFNHEFRKLSGLYPSEYLSQRRRDLPELEKGESVAFTPQR